jgi:hypothetical protein
LTYIYRNSISEMMTLVNCSETRRKASKTRTNSKPEAAQRPRALSADGTLSSSTGDYSNMFSQEPTSSSHLLCGACDSEDVCPICLDPPSDAITLECSHRFCSPCLHTWLTSKSGAPGRECPSCKGPVGRGALRLLKVSPDTSRSAAQAEHEPGARLIHCEWAFKRGVSAFFFKSWRRRYIKVYDNRVEWHKARLGAARGSMVISPLSSVVRHPQLPLTIVFKSNANARGRAPELVIQAASSDEMDAWLNAIRTAIGVSVNAGAPMSDAERRTLMARARREHWKYCPGCRATIEKNRGCDNMRCRCGRHFKWSEARVVAPCRRVHLDHSWWGSNCVGCSPVAKVKLAAFRTLASIFYPAGFAATGGLIAAVALPTVLVPVTVCAPLAVIYEPVRQVRMLLDRRGADRRSNPFATGSLMGLCLVFVCLNGPFDDD